MKSIFASAALLLATGAAYAQSEADYFVHQAQRQKSTLTREQVKAEVMRARAAGELDFNEGNYPPQQPFVSTRTRDEVKAEVVAARANGELDYNEATYGGFFDSHPANRAPVNLTAKARAVKTAQ